MDKLIDIWVDAFRNNKVISEKDRNIVRESLALMKQSENLYNQKMELKKSINDAHLTNSPSKCQFDAAVEALENDTIIQIFNDGCKTVYEKIEDQKIRKVILEVKLAINILYELTIDTIERLNSILYIRFKHDFCVTL